jgi:hypothetical protein
MSAIRREDLLDCLRKLHQERMRFWDEASKRDLGCTVTHGYLGVADGIDFALAEIAARFGIELEEIELAHADEAKPEKKMAASKGEATRDRNRKIS